MAAIRLLREPVESHGDRGQLDLERVGQPQVAGHEKTSSKSSRTGSPANLPERIKGAELADGIAELYRLHERLELEAATPTARSRGAGSSERV